MTRRRRLTATIALAAPLYLFTPGSAQQVSGADRAQVLHTTAKAAFNAGDYALAEVKFRELTRVAQDRAEGLAARYGLGLTLVEGPSKDYRAALELFAYVTAYSKEPGQLPFAHYYSGLCQRGVALDQRRAATTRPAQKLTNNADASLRYAAQSFAAAAEHFLRLGETHVEWAARAKCDQADALIRLNRFKEAMAAAEPVAIDVHLSETRYRSLGLYLHGHAAFSLQDHAAAGRSLSRLAPFDQPDVGPAAQFLLARTHHQLGERAEAAAAYGAIVATHDQSRTRAEESLKNADALELTEAQRRHLESTLKTTPDVVARALFYQGLLAADANDFAGAARFYARCAATNPADAALAADAALRLGVARLHTGDAVGAIAALTPLKDGPLADRAHRHLAAAQLALNPKGPEARAAAVDAAVAHLQRALDLLKDLPQGDLDGRNRRAQVQLELADALRLANQPKRAAALYQAVAQSPVSPDLIEQAHYRHLASLQLAGEWSPADDATQRFIRSYPKSPLLADVFLRHAENAALQRGHPEATRRFQAVLTRFPDTPQSILAAFGLANVHYQQGNFADAVKLLEQIPDTDRTGDLSVVSYLHADCILRTLPGADATDALATARVLQQLERAAALLNAFLTSSEAPRPQTPDAQLKYAHVQQRIAGLIVDPVERRKAMNFARRAYAQVITNFPDHPAYALAVLENAKINTQFGAGRAAVTELAKFQKEPLASHPLAPVALIHLGDALRVARNAPAAVTLLAGLREQHETGLAADPRRAPYVPVLQWSLALALKESNRYDEAKALFQQVALKFPRHPQSAEVPWRVLQCDRDEALARLAAAQKTLNTTNKPEPRTAALSQVDAAAASLRKTAEALASAADALAGKETDSDLPPQMQYDAAWCWRAVIDVEVDAARRVLQQQAVRKLQDRLAGDDPGRNVIRPPEIPLASIPLQPAEQNARRRYIALIESSPDSFLSNDARFELAELAAGRDEHDLAVKVLTTLLANSNLTPDLLDRARLRLAASHLAKGDPASAAKEFETILQSPKSAYAGYARLGQGEALFLRGDHAAVVALFTPYRDERFPGRNSLGLLDRVLLRLAQSHAALNQPEQVRAVLEPHLAKFQYRDLQLEARFTLAAALSQLKQHEQAHALFADVASRTTSDLGARSLLQSGLIRLGQDRPAEALSPLLTLAHAFDAPELNAQALLATSKAYLALGKPDDARAALRRILKDFPNTTHAQEASQRLAEIKQ